MLIARPAAATRTANLALAVPQLPSPGVIVQRALNLMVPVINNTPIRDLLDTLDGTASTSGLTRVRLLGRPVGTALSPDGTRAYVITEGSFTGLGLVGALFGQTLTVNVIDTKTNTIVGVPVVFKGDSASTPLWSPDGTRAYLGIARSGSTVLTTINNRNGAIVGAPTVMAGAAGLVSSPGGDSTYLVVHRDAGSTLTRFDTTTGTAVGPSVEVEGDPHLSFNPAVNRLYLSTQHVSEYPIVVSTVLTVVDTADNTVVGGPITLDGQPIGGVVVSPDGTRAIQVTRGFGTAVPTTVTMIDPETGAVVGTPLALDGWVDPSFPALLTQDGARLSVLTSDGLQPRITVIDTATASVVGTPVALPSYEQAVVLDPAGDRVAVSSETIDSATGTFHTVVTIVDTANSTVVGAPIVLDGMPVRSGLGLVVSPDGSKVLETTRTTVATIGVNGTLISPPTVIERGAISPALLSPDGSRAYQATGTSRPAVIAIDTNTGAVIGSPVTVKGDYGSALMLTPDGAHLYDTTPVTVFAMDLFFPLPIPPFIVPTQIKLTWGRVNAIDTAAVWS